MPIKNKLKIVLWRGDTLFIPVRVKVAGNAWPLAGYRIIFTLKDDPTKSDEEAIIQYDYLVTAEDSMGKLGLHNIVISAELTQTLEIGVSYSYQLMFVSPTGAVTTHHWGTLPTRDS
jgi:hypothetical protein